MPPDDRATRQRALLMLVALVFAWGLSWPANKAILESIPPLWMVALRAAIALVAVSALALGSGRLTPPPRGDWPVVISIALLHMVGYSLLVSLGLALVPAGRSIVLGYTTPLWVMPGAALFLGERLGGRRAVGMALGLAGLAALFNPFAFDWEDRDAVLGNLSLLAGAAFWAASILHIRGHRWHSTPFALVPWEMLIATIVLVLIALVAAPWPEIAWTPRLIALLLFVGIPGTVLPYWASAVASKGLPAITMSLGLLAVPVVGVITATLALGEALTMPLLLAIALILGGVALGTTEAPTRRT